MKLIIKTNPEIEIEIDQERLSPTPTPAVGIPKEPVAPAFEVQTETTTKGRVKNSKQIEKHA
jgi:hypothetical protein